MGVFLSILSTIGWVLLIILIVVAVLIALILFLPVVYRVKIRKTEKLLALGSVRWLFGAVLLSYSFAEEKFDWHLRVFGFPLDKHLKKKETEEAKKQKPKQEEYEPAKKQPTIQPAKKEYGQIAKLSEDEVFEEERKPGLFEKIRLTFAKIRDILGKAKEFKALFDRAKPVLFRLLKHIFPKKIEGTVEFGLEDPASTGMFLGLVAALCLPIPKKLRIIPDFQEARLECDVKIAGRIFLIYLLIQAIRLLRMPEVKKLLGGRKKRKKRKDLRRQYRRRYRRRRKAALKKRKKIREIEKETKAQKETGNGGK